MPGSKFSDLICCSHFEFIQFRSRRTILVFAFVRRYVIKQLLLAESKRFLSTCVGFCVGTD